MSTTETKSNFEQRWKKKLFPRIAQKTLTPRIYQDLLKYKPKVKGRDIDKSLFICGSVGSGKTIYAAALLMEAIKQDHKIASDTLDGYIPRLATRMFITAPELLMKIRSTFNKPKSFQDTEGITWLEDEMTEKDIIDQYGNMEMLVLDDLGAEKQSEWALQTLYLIINKRYENLKPTIITSNMSLDELGDALGNDRIPSRIYAMCEQLNFGNKDLRVK
jgi:DNA replication protein DnaC